MNVDRYYRIDIRVTAEERDTLKIEAVKARMKLGEYVRSMLGLRQYIRLRNGKVTVDDR